MSDKSRLGSFRQLAQRCRALQARIISKSKTNSKIQSSLTQNVHRNQGGLDARHSKRDASVVEGRLVGRPSADEERKRREIAESIGMLCQPREVVKKKKRSRGKGLTRSPPS